MDWQEPLALLIVLVTAGFFVWPRLRRPRYHFQRETHCGCSARSNVTAPQSIIFRARKGKPSEIILRAKS